MKFLTWFVVITASIVSGCSNAEDNRSEEVIEEIILYSPDEEKRPIYKLSIPSDYVNNAEKGTASVKAAYPGMVSFLPEIRHRFYEKDGTWGPDLVRVFFGLRPEYEGSDREFTNRNDAGKFALESMARQNLIESRDISDTIKQPEKVKRFIYPNEKDYQKTYVITQEDGRLSVIRCSYKTNCEGTTSWQGKIAITYQFTRENLENIVDLDKSVINLFDTFNPTLLIDEE